MMTDSPRFTLRSNRVIAKTVTKPKNTTINDNDIESTTQQSRVLFDKDETDDFLNSFNIEFEFESTRIESTKSKPSKIDDFVSEFNNLAINSNEDDETAWYLTQSNKGGYKVRIFLLLFSYLFSYLSYLFP